MISTDQLRFASIGRKPKHRLAAMLVAGIAVPSAACGSTNTDTPKASSNQIPERLVIAATPYTSGLMGDKNRREGRMPAFSMAKHPTTVAQYRACVSSGVCAVPNLDTYACRGAVNRVPDGAPPAVQGTMAGSAGGPLSGPTYSLPDADHFPVTCATVDQARKFCNWAGGQLASTDQWLLAARGTSPRHFAWGNRPADCTMHPSGRPSFSSILRGTKRTTPFGACATSPADFAVGRHPAASSPFGIEDVLLTSAELTNGQSSKDISVCAAGPCYVQAVSPGGIDAFAATSTKREAIDRAQVTYGFRCAFEESSQ